MHKPDDQAIDPTEDIIPADLPLLPELRRRHEDITGVECPFADGQVWLLARTVDDPSLGWLRDELCDQLALEGLVPLSSLRAAVGIGLAKNYLLTEEDIQILLGDYSEGYSLAARVGLLEPIYQIIGSMLPATERCDFTHEDWYRSSLIMNGVDPDRLKADDAVAVLEHLKRLGRIVPMKQFVSAAIAGDERKRTAAIIQAQRESKPAEIPADPECPLNVAE